jgi:HPt (histidine-containing phosphotransfer) domain-containing protein
MSDDANPAYPAPQGVPAVALLNVTDALALLGDNTELYLQIAQDFCAELSALQPELARLLHPEADLGETKRVLHTFKGLSLTVGASPLSGAFRQAEAWIKDCERLNAPPDATALAVARQQLMAACAATLSAFAQVLPQLARAPDPASAQTINPPLQLDTDQLLDDLRTLLPLLETNNVRATDVNADIQKRYPAAHARLNALEAAVQSFDFVQGVVQCQALIRSLSDNN